MEELNQKINKFFNVIVDIVFGIILLFIVIGIAIGAIRLFGSLWELLSFEGITGHYINLILNPVDVSI